MNVKGDDATHTHTEKQREPETGRKDMYIFHNILTHFLDRSTFPKENQKLSEWRIVKYYKPVQAPYPEVRETPQTDVARYIHPIQASITSPYGKAQAGTWETSSQRF